MWDVVGITESPGTTVIHLQGKKKVRIDAARGARQFVDAIGVHYRTVQKKGFALPDIPEKLFNGYLANPRDFLLAFGFVQFVLLSFLAVTCFIVFKPDMPKETFELSFTEFRVTIEDDELYIQKPGDKVRFVCTSYQRVLQEEGLSTDDFLAEIEQQSAITILVDKAGLEKVRAGESSQLKIYQLGGDNGKILLHYESTRKGRQQSLIPGIWGMIGINLLEAAFMAFICYVVAHAPYFPRLVRLLIKEEWLNI